jgi:hypothetical protein
VRVPGLLENPVRHKEQNSANDLNSGSTPSKFDSLVQPLQQALDGLNKECRKAGRRYAASSVPAFLHSLFEIFSF